MKKYLICVTNRYGHSRDVVVTAKNPMNAIAGAQRKHFDRQPSGRYCQDSRARIVHEISK